MSSHIAATSGAISLGLGAYGYIKTGSRPSLIGGASLASMFLTSAYLIRRSDYQCSAHTLSAVAGTVSLVLGIRRFTKSAGSPTLGAIGLLLVGVMNVPYQYIKAYEWI